MQLYSGLICTFINRLQNPLIFDIERPNLFVAIEFLVQAIRKFGSIHFVTKPHRIKFCCVQALKSVLFYSFKDFFRLTEEKTSRSARSSTSATSSLTLQ